MTLDEYLEQFIEGYLFGDLRAMASITGPSEKPYGAVAYPMVMTAISGIEVLGVLTSRTSFNEQNGANRFGEFWRNYVYRDRPAFQRLDSLVYEMVRHGLAHSFLAKPMIRVTKHRDPNHLRRVKDGKVFILDALTLAEDFETGYRRWLRPAIDGAFKIEMETRFREFRDAYWEDHVEWRHAFEKAPTGVDILTTEAIENRSITENQGGHVAISTSVLRVNSPTIGPGHQNISTSDFDDPNG